MFVRIMPIIQVALQAVNTRTISLPTSDIKTWKLIGVSREVMEDALKALQINPKMFERRTNALRDILLQTEDQAKKLASSVLNTNDLRLQTEYLGTRMTKVTIHGVPVDICPDRMRAFFTKFGQVHQVKILRSKAGIATSDMEMSVTVDRKIF